MKTFKKLLLWGQVVSWEPGDQEIPGLTTKVYSGVFKGKIQFPCGFYRIWIIDLKLQRFYLNSLLVYNSEGSRPGLWGTMVLPLHTSVTCNNLISECDFRQSSSLWQTGGEQDVCLQKSQTFPEVPWAGHSGLHQWRKGQLCTWWVEMDTAVPQRNSNLSHVCTANKE